MSTTNNPRTITTDRNSAIEWWDKLPMFDLDSPCKRMLSNQYFQNEPSFLTERQIEFIWKNEVEDIF